MGDYGALFLVFVVLNTVLSFRAGAKSAKWNSMLAVFYFLKHNNCLKNTDQITDFDYWPDMLKKAYTEPEDLI